MDIYLYIIINSILIKFYLILIKIELNLIKIELNLKQPINNII
jgi:hypothetical protein